MEFLENLTKLLDERHDTRTNLARNIGISESAIRQWYQGRLPTIDKVIKISQYFSIDINELLGTTPLNNINYLYSKLTPKDKEIVDNILSRYETQEQESSTSMIG